MRVYYIKYKDGIKRDNHFIKKAYVAMITCLCGIKTNATTLDRMDKTCEEALKIGQRIGYWICVFMCVYEIVKKVKDGDTQAIWGIIVKYGIAYGAVFVVRFVLDMIGEWFA